MLLVYSLKCIPRCYCDIRSHSWIDHLCYVYENRLHIMLALDDRYWLLYLAFFWSFFFITIIITVLNVFFIRSELVTVLISIAIASIYSIYLLIDTQLILGGGKAELTMDNYVLGAVLLYIDIIQLFIRILRILGKRNQWNDRWYDQ